MTSPDGITWTARAATEANQWTSVIYGKGLFVAIAYDGTNRVMTSPDGITWTNGGSSPGFIPTRYSGSESSQDSKLRLAKKTEWDQKDEELYIGLGQRLLATNESEFPLLELRTIEFAPAPAAT